MRRLIFAAALAASSACAGAADFGLGVSVQSHDALLYLPIEVNSRFRIEPSIRYFDGETTTQNTHVFTPYTVTTTSKLRQLEFSVGFFGVSPLAESVRLYYGARVAYIDAKNSSSIVTQFDAQVDVLPPPVQAEDISTDGYRISPTLGFEYAINEHFSIGGEAQWFYENLDADGEFDDVVVSTDAESTGTDTRLIVRFRF